MNKEVFMFDKIIENSKNDMIQTVCELIKFPSVSTQTNDASMPFGEACKNALDYTLRLAEKLGFRTKNLDGYCGYIEFGEGEELVGIIGHLDVVPAKLEDGWSSPPFEPQIRENKLYGRGSIDDKGPVVASLYAMKAILDSGKKLNKRVRFILGLNEEKDWNCIHYYKQIGEETPTIGFSPDADFPCIYAEKGILSVRLTHPFSISNQEILNIDCNHNALNVVPKYCSITLKDKTSNDVQKLEFTGTPAHAAHPDLGDNAITKLVEFLNANLDKNLLENEFTFLQKLYELDLFNIHSPKFFSDAKIEDESGILTSNVGFLGYENNTLEIGFNLRVPVTTPLSEIKAKFETLAQIFPDIGIKFTSEQAPLYVPKDSYLVQTLTRIFNEKTNQNLEPIAIGGGTFARAFPNMVAFGANMPNQKDMCHQVDEFIDIDTLLLSSKIYANAIYELAK